MKIVLGKYLNYFGPYQIAHILKRVGISEDSCDKIGELLSRTYLSQICQFVYDKRKRTVKVKIDKFDTWDMSSSLAIIILPMLKQLNETKHGAPYTKDEDVPEHLSSVNAEPKEHEYDIDSHHFERWDWIMSEMIWAFEQLQPDCDWEDRYWIVKPELDLSEKSEDEGKLLIPIRWKTEGQHDRDGYKLHSDRISNGVRLFGVYFQSLWD